VDKKLWVEDMGKEMTLPPIFDISHGLHQTGFDVALPLADASSNQTFLKTEPCEAGTSPTVTMTRLSLSVRLGLAAFAALLCVAAASAQTTDRSPRETALRFLREHPSDLGLSASDVADVRVTDEYKSEDMGVTHVWIQQQWAGIPVFNALFGLHVKTDGEVFHLGHRFVPDLKSKVNTILPSLSAEKALQMAMLDLGFEGFQTPQLRQKINDKNWVFEGGAVSRSQIPVSICFEQIPGGLLRLAWTMAIAQANTNDLWNMRVDAQTGQVLGKINQTNHCALDAAGSSSAVHPAAPPSPPNGDGASYRVFALPTESPAHGPRTLVTDPADATASPFGWHDINGAAGAEYTYPRGNNVYAFEDSDGNGAPPSGTPGPSGGASLKFDFPFDPNAELAPNLDAAITNVFYTSNKMHDISYRYGFNEVAGNFQTNNYGKGGTGGDPVLASAIYGNTENNSSFVTPVDGGSGQLQMYKWNRAGGKIVTVNGPQDAKGKYFASATDGWGKLVSNTPVTGEVVIANDGSAQPTLGCNPLLNNMTGKIALIDRQICTYVDKALNAQNAGAIGCIICNFKEGTAALGSSQPTASDVKIPVVMVQKSDCDFLRKFAGAGLNVSLVLDVDNSGPNQLDGDFDNGIIAHEYTHGISQRLTGGPNNVGCLGNTEQMGEGWSDFFALAVTAGPGDTGAKKRGIGTYVLRQSNTGTGIRRYPYCTDMSISPVTYGSVAENSQIHALGEVWSAMLWDLYWAMADKYGFDPDLNNQTSGNARALQLVMDGLKLQPCSPGFRDGRDAIMQADRLRYNGADTCMISSVFARRGLGYYASQGLSTDAGDGVENFDPIPYCIKELKIKKATTTPTITAGQEASFQITVANHKSQAATGVKVSDELPAGLSLVSASDGGKFENGYVVWDLGAMPSNTAKILSYTAKSAPNIGSDVFFNDDLEDQDEWFSTQQDGSQFFAFQNNIVHTGNYAWLASSLPVRTDFALETTQSFVVQGTRPALRFWHQYTTEAGADAGFLEIKEIGQVSWSRFAPEKVVRHPYPNKVQYLTFAIPGVGGFSGKSGGWIQSYFDLSDWAGKNVTIRFRFGTNAESALFGDGWVVDDVEQINLFKFDTEACITDGNGFKSCAKAPESGVIVNRGAIAAQEASDAVLALLVQPNPSSDILNVTLGQATKGPVQLLLVAADGRVVWQSERDAVLLGQVLPLDIRAVPAGVYVLRVETSVGNGVAKVVVQK